MAYTATVSLQTQDRTAKLRNNYGYGIFQASCDVTNYNSALVEITAITGRFQTVVAVMGETSDLGYYPQWVPSSKAFKMYKMPTGTAGGANVEVGEDVDAGGFFFTAVGLV